MRTDETLVLLFCVATAVALFVRRFRIPYTVALVLVGLGMGALHLVSPPRLTRELLFTFFLPGLLFEAAFHLDLSALRSVWRSVALLAVPGVVISIFIVAALTMFGLRAAGMDGGASWRTLLVFGGLVAATDPVAVTALFRQLAAPTRLATLIEAESLFNDGTAVVLLSILLASDSSASPISMVPSFFLVAGGGVAVGLAVGFVITQLIRRVDDAMIEIALTMIAAFGSFVAAESMHTSGVVATVVAGIVCSRDRKTGMSAAAHHAAESFWQYVAFALNSIVFLLIGFELQSAPLARMWLEITIAFLAMLVARIAIVGGLAATMSRTSERIPQAWSAIVAWGGLRGALSMVLALALPRNFPDRERWQSIAVGAVVMTLLLQGLTMPLLVRRLGIKGQSPPL